MTTIILLVRLLHNAANLDFRLQNGVEIEVKRFHSPRIAEQMARAENVVAVQGKGAVEYVASLFDRITALEAEVARLKQADAERILRDAMMQANRDMPRP